MSEILTIDPRFSGFPDVAYGGYVGGRLSQGLGSAEVRFRKPIPVGVPLTVERGSAGVVLRSDDVVLADAHAARVDVGAIPVVAPADAMEATRDHLGSGVHLFPSCFCCGPARSADTGLRVFVGRIAGGRVVAGAWTPSRSFAHDDGTLPFEIAWSATDCPSIWALVADAPPITDDRVVTGTLAVDVLHPLRAGERYVVTAWPLGREGRRLYAATAIVDERGTPMVIAKQTCVVTDAGIPLAGAVWFPAARPL